MTGRGTARRARFARTLGRCGPASLALMVVAIYLYAAITAASHAQLWLDEILSVWVARLPTVADVMRAMWRGADYSPPTYEIVLHALFVVLGHSGALAARVVSIVSVLGAGFVLVAIASRYVRPGPAWLTVAVLLNSSIFDFAIQARQYAVLCFITSIALLVWDRDFGGRPWLKTLTLWIVLTLAVSTHFYGVLVIGVIAVAEVMQWVIARQFRREVWLAIVLTSPVAVAWAPYFLHLSHFHIADTLSPRFYARPDLGAFSAALVATFLGNPPGFELLLILEGTLVALALLVWSRSTAAASLQTAPQERPQATSLYIMLAALSAIPVMAFALSALVTHAFSPRYISSFALMPALLAGLIVDRSPRPNLLSAALLLFICPMLAARAHDAFHDPAKALALIQTLPTGEKIVVGEARLYIELMEAAPPTVRSRLVYLRSKTGDPLLDTTNEHILLLATRYHPGLTVMDRGRFVSAVPDFYVLARPTVSADGTTPSLLKAGILKRPLAVCGRIVVYHATRGADLADPPRLSCPPSTT